MEIPKYFYFRVHAVEDADVMIEDASDADVVEVVRCEKCKHWRKNISDVETCRINREIDGSERETRPDFFCGDGKRRDDDGEIH